MGSHEPESTSFVSGHDFSRAALPARKPRPPNRTTAKPGRITVPRTVAARTPYHKPACRESSASVSAWAILHHS